MTFNKEERNMMFLWDEITAYLIIIAAASYVVHNIYKTLRGAKQGCSGCSGCGHNKIPLPLKQIKGFKES